MRSLPYQLGLKEGRGEHVDLEDPGYWRVP